MQLSEIEAAIGVLDYVSLRKTVTQTRDYTLDSHKDHGPAIALEQAAKGCKQVSPFQLLCEKSL